MLMVMTMDANIDLYLLALRAEKGYSDKTIISYAHDLRQFCEFVGADKQWEGISKADLRRFLSHLSHQGYAKSSVARKISCLRSFFEYLLRNNIVPLNPATTIELPKRGKPLPTFLYAKEMEHLLSLPANTPLGIRDRALLEMLYATGCRASEIIGLKLLDIDWLSRTIKVMGKGAKERIVPFGRLAESHLREYIDKARAALALGQECSYVFVNYRGTTLSQRSLGRIVKKYVVQASFELGVTPHSLRHTFATHMLDNGADLRSVQELLGHVSISTTQVYTHVTGERIKTVYGKSHPRA